MHYELLIQYAQTIRAMDHPLQILDICIHQNITQIKSKIKKTYKKTPLIWVPRFQCMELRYDLLPKTDGGRRPIGLFPTVIQLWMRSRICRTSAWEAATALPSLFGDVWRGRNGGATRCVAGSLLHRVCGPAMQRPHSGAPRPCQSVRNRAPAQIIRGCQGQGLPHCGIPAQAPG